MNCYLVSKTMYDSDRHFGFDELICVCGSSYSANRKIEKLEKELFDEGFKKIRQPSGIVYVRDDVEAKFNIVELPYVV